MFQLFFNNQKFQYSSYREGLLKSLLEAASCALPIIASNVPGCKEICHNEYNGFLVKPKDHKDLAKAIQKIN